MDLDDLVPKKTSPLAFGQEDLSRYSIEDLDERILALEAEIARCKANKKSKQATLDAANVFFKK